MISGLIPKDQPSTKYLGLAIGVYGKCCPITATLTPPFSKYEVLSKTGSSHSVSKTLLPRKDSPIYQLILLSDLDQR